jgi:glutaminyl-tRNA synthetase
MSEEIVSPAPSKDHFITDYIDADNASGVYNAQVVTRFPPEPNGYLHIGHAKSICLNFGLAARYEGRCHLRFDDTNPEKESQEYIDSIKRDVAWLGFRWNEHEYYASDYFEKIFDYALELIDKGLAYVCDLNGEEIRKYRGALGVPGKESPWRNRTPAENKDLFLRMRAGEFPEGSHVLRAKIDMSAGNMNMRDPVLFRIRKVHHHRQGDKWCIYPMYDFTHPISDALEGVTHSICTLEFEDHRPLYDWTLQNITIDCKPRQIEFARLNLSYTVMSKRKLLQLVEEGRVQGWNDPRMPTIAGMRRRGYTPEAIRNFCDRIGVAKRDSTVHLGLLEFCIREDLNARSLRYLGVLNPLKVEITTWEAGHTEYLDARNHPEDPARGTRKLPFTREVWIDREDFMEEPPKKYFRLAPGREVRLRWGYVIRCEEVVRDAQGNVVLLRCSHDPLTKGGTTPDGRKVKGTIQWVSVEQAIPCEFRLYDNLFSVENPSAEGGEDGSFLDYIHSESLVIKQGFAESALATLSAETNVQLERIGYFVTDSLDSKPDSLVLNRTVTLKDSWQKEVGK